MRIFATQFKGHFLEHRPRGLCNPRPCFCASGKRDGFDSRVLNDGSPSRLSGAVDDVQDTGRQPGFDAKFRQQVGRVGGDFRRFCHDSIACCQSWSYFPCEKVQRQVPGTDATDYANGLTQCVIDRVPHHFVGFT